MTAKEFHSYRFTSDKEPSDEMLSQLMGNAAEKVRKSNRESDEIFFAELRKACNEAKSRSTRNKMCKN